MSTSLFTRDDPAWAVAATVLAMVLASVFFFANALRRRTGAAREPAPAGGAKSTNPVDPAKENERDATEHTPYRIADLYIYPIKSCAGERVKTARTCATGFEQDRRYMVINAKGRFMTQRQFPKMALIRPKLLDKGGLELHAPHMKLLRVPLADGSGEDEPQLHTVTVWGDTFEGAVDQGSAVAQWLDRYLGADGLRLVYMPDSCKRFLSAKEATEMASSRVSFADGFPFLLTSKASLEEVQKATDVDIRMNRFRPNIVVEGCPAFDEDTWRRFKAGDRVIFHGRKRCVRCKIPTTCQETGEQAGTKAPPYTTLQGVHATSNNLPLFGNNLVHDWRGFGEEVSCGDPIRVIRVSSAQPPL